jgi:hypothetical protein
VLMQADMLPAQCTLEEHTMPLGKPLSGAHNLPDNRLAADTSQADRHTLLPAVESYSATVPESAAY